MKGDNVIGLIILAMVSVLLALTLWMTSRTGVISGQKGWTVSEQLELANLLLTKGLKREASGVLESYLETHPGDKKERAKACYRLGSIYLDLCDYERALKWFYAAEILDKDADFKEELNNRIIEALEKAGMSTEAQYELEARTVLGGSGKKDGKIVARIGKDVITEEEINQVLNELPEWKRKEFTGEKGRIEFIRGYIATEVLYRKAKRLGLDQNLDVRKALESVRKQLVVNKLVEEEVSKKIKFSPHDLKLYYQANKEKYMEEREDKKGEKVKRQKEFEEVQDEVEYDYTMEKQKEMMDELIKRALEEQEVEIYEPSKKEDRK